MIDLAAAYDDQDVPHAEPVTMKRQFINTTVGRVIFNDHLPKEMPFINGLHQEEGRAAARAITATCASA